MRKKTKPLEKKSPQVQAIDEILKEIDKEIIKLEKIWIDLAQATRGKIKLFFLIIETKERLAESREAVRKELGEAAFKQHDLTTKFKAFTVRLKTLKKAIPPLIISGDNNGNGKVVG